MRRSGWITCRACGREAYGSVMGGVCDPCCDQPMVGVVDPTKVHRAGYCLTYPFAGVCVGMQGRLVVTEDSSGRRSALPTNEAGWHLGQSVYVDEAGFATHQTHSEWRS